MNHKANVAILFIVFVLGFACSLEANTLPLFFRWRQANFLDAYPNGDEYRTQWSNSFRWHMGIDTTLTIPVNIRVTFTQEEDFLKDPVLLENAIIRYNSPNHLSFKLSAENFGYGKNWYLHQRLNEDPLNDQNALLEYRWYGSAIGYNTKPLGVIAGYGGNRFNNSMAYIELRHHSTPLSAELYFFDVTRDNQWNLHTLYSGIDTELRITRILPFSTRHAFQYELNRADANFEGHKSVKYMQETSFRFIGPSALVFSLEYLKQDNKDILWQSELLGQYATGIWQFLPNVRYGENNQDSYWKPGFQIDFEPVTLLRFGLYYEALLPETGKTTHHIGFQATYRLDVQDMYAD